MKKLIVLAAIYVAACSTNSHIIRHEARPAVIYPNPAPEVAPRSEELHWWGYRIVDGNISYEHDTRAYNCILTLGNDARLKDMWCDGTVNEIEDNQGYQSCFYHPESSRCNLANEIFARKKELLRVGETNQRWLETGGEDILRDYLD